MTVRASYIIKGIIDKGAGQPKTVLATSQTDLSIPLESRVMKSSGYNSLSLTTDNQALLAQLQVGGVILADISVQANAPAIAPAPAPVAAQLIAINDWPSTILQVGDNHVISDEWGIGNLTRGTYTDINGTHYEQKIGVSQQLGTNGEISWRMEGKWPTGTTEVKAYPAAHTGNQPGWYHATDSYPDGMGILLPDGSYSTAYPSGMTPNTFFALPLPLTSLKASLTYTHNSAPTGRGHLTFDIWLQNTATQGNGFAAPPVTHEIMIPVDAWGSPSPYGAYPARNPSWYVKDATIDGRLYHCYYAPTFNGSWTFIVYEPDVFGIQPGTIDVAAFVNHAKAQGWTDNGPAGAATHIVDVNFGVEPVDGTFDITVSNYLVYR